ncbi:unnamed protein product [Heligmosomoides polygyrus]|uniref:Uncharacterized protein n=1 Tax=Heligmosomoides polygyrus TaxID=6339 RepID=A0A183FVB5_HELPZ|nr:unnamed protein product [Heligmosomoides polygyrus]
MWNNAINSDLWEPPIDGHEAIQARPTGFLAETLATRTTTIRELRRRPAGSSYEAPTSAVSTGASRRLQFTTNSYSSSFKAMNV